MGNIFFLIVFFILRPLIKQLLESQKTEKTTPMRKRQVRPQIKPDFQVKTIRIEEPAKPIQIEEKRPVENSIIHHIEPVRYETKTVKCEPDNQVYELFTQDNILRGIILKEILSPPKSLFPRR